MRSRLIPRRPASLRERALALEALASLLSGGLAVESALSEWHDNVPPGIAPSLLSVRRLLALGAPTAVAVAAAEDPLGEDLAALQAALALHTDVGANPVPMIERAAELLRRRADSQAAGRAAASGARLSGWMVGGLPLVSLPLLPMAKAPLLDPAGLAVLFFGVALTAGGMFWMARLVPRARPADEPLALFADHVAAGLRAGASLFAALEVAARHAPATLGEQLGRARRRTNLGQPWSAALKEADPQMLGALAMTLQRAERLGSPLVPALEAFAETVRVDAQRAFEREVRRAPVLMVLPLVLCVLPAFGLLAIVPFLRGIAFA